MHGVDERARVEDAAGCAGVLDQHTGDVALGQTLGEVGNHHVDPHRPGPGADHLDGLGQGVVVDHERTGDAAPRAAYQRHRLRGRGALVQQAGVGGGQPGQVADHRLEVEECLEATLGDLGLVGRVRRVPARVLEDVAPDHRRRDRRVVAETDHRLGRLVQVGQPAQLARCVVLREGVGEVESPRGDPRRDGRGHQVLERVEPDPAEHPGDVVGTRPEVSVGEDGLLAHGWLLDWIVRFASPSVGPEPVLQSCLTRTVLAPERFRGGVAPSALRSRV